MAMTRRRNRANWRVLAIVPLFAGFVAVTGGSAGSAPVGGGCGGDHWVATWMAAPSDSASLADFSFNPITSVGDQTYRMVITPHRAGATLRVHLTNRLSPAEVSFTSVTVGKQAGGPQVSSDSLRTVTFDGASSVTVPAGGDVVSDPVALSFGSFEPLAVSVYVPGSSRAPTEHLQGMATSYYGSPGTGDQTHDVGGGSLDRTTTSVLYVSGVDVLAPASASTLVAFGDSITEGFVGGGYSEVPQSPAAVDQNLRPTDFLQRRLDAAGIPISVVNSGIWGNRLLDDALRTLPQLGPRGLTRIQPDVLEVAGVTDAIVMFGANDFAIPEWATTAEMIAGYTEAVYRLQAAGIRVVLGTNPPLKYSLLAGNFAPFSDQRRVELNDWVRSQQIADGVVDYDALLADPNADAIILSQYRGLDNHVGPAGYAAMADLIDIAALRGSGCGRN